MGTKKQSVQKPADAKPKKAQDTGEATSVVVVGAVNRSWFSGIPYLNKLSPRTSFIILFGALLVLIIALFIVANSLKSDSKGAQLPTPQQAADNAVDSLLQTPPDSTASSSTKVSYYRRLSVAQADVDKYSDAIASFKQAQAQGTDDLTYTDYMDLARYYHAAGNNKSALNALDTAATLMPTTPDDNKGYYPELATQRINQLREEYSK